MICSICGPASARPLGSPPRIGRRGAAAAGQLHLVGGAGEAVDVRLGARLGAQVVQAVALQVTPLGTIRYVFSSLVTTLPA